MGVKTITGIVLLGLVVIAVLSFAQAAPPDEPPGKILDRITDLWTNATQQQSAIEAETDARLSHDQALWTNATEQQNALDAIQPPVHFGDPDMWATDDQKWEPDVIYQAETDGFVCVFATMGISNSAFVGCEAYKYSEGGPGIWLHESAAVMGGSITMPVPQGYYWHVHVYDVEEGDYTIFWVPLTP
jgi:hypothetical protein